MNDLDVLVFGKQVMRAEAEGISSARDIQSDSFASVCNMIVHCSGKVVVSGVGKAGLIGKKISATMASTGTPSIWLDPINALHGDLGMVDAKDIALLISNSGSSGELLLTAKGLRALGVTLIAMTRSIDTLLAKMCDHTLELGLHEEACPLNLAPSTSTSVMLALGDAVALTVLKMRGFSEQDYARYHPAGALGRRVVPVEHLMRIGKAMAIVGESAVIGDAVQAITKARCGLCMIIDEVGRLKGVYTDGDFRRDWSAGVDIGSEKVSIRMNKAPRSIKFSMTGGDALDLMRQIKVNALPVMNTDHKVVGLLDIQDLV
jgi:arabinose-5-phosphate isomerase